MMCKNQSGVVEFIKKKMKKIFDNLYLTHRFSSHKNVELLDVIEVFITCEGLTCFSGKMCPICASKMKIILFDVIHADLSYKFMR